jgi:hypothetical protein
MNLSNVNLETNDDNEIFAQYNQHAIKKKNNIHKPIQKQIIKSQMKPLKKKNKKINNNIKKLREEFSQNVQLVNREDTMKNDYMGNLIQKSKKKNTDKIFEEQARDYIEKEQPLINVEQKMGTSGQEQEQEQETNSPETVKFDENDINEQRTFLSLITKLLLVVLFCLIVYLVYCFILKKESMSEILGKFNISTYSNNSENTTVLDELSQTINKTVNNLSTSSNVIEMSSIKPVYHGGQSYINDKNLVQDITTVLEQFSTTK